jgi:hypothetical protein
MKGTFDSFGPALAAAACRLVRCSRGATISEYAIGAILLVAAAGAAQSPRLHTAREARPQVVQAPPAPTEAAAARERHRAPRESRRFER